MRLFITFKIAVVVFVTVVAAFAVVAAAAGGTTSRFCKVTNWRYSRSITTQANVMCKGVLERK